MNELIQLRLIKISGDDTLVALNYTLADFKDLNKQLFMWNALI